MENLESGELIPVDKPLFWTSFDVVAHFRRAVKPLKIGHAGTLDPLATGLLILCSGKMTKRIEEIQHWPKTYTGYFYLGNQTASFDRETPRLHAADEQLPDDAAIHAAVLKLTGHIMQIPPGYSALKVDGQAAYRQAHKGEVRQLLARPATVYSFTVGKLFNRLLPFSIACSKGTYIRAIANDLGNILGCGAFLHQLRRTHIGEIGVAGARNELWAVEATRGNKIRENLTHAGFNVTSALHEAQALQKGIPV